MKFPVAVLLVCLVPALVSANQENIVPAPSPADSLPELNVRSIAYNGQLSDNEARFTIQLEVESLTRETATITLFDGEVALFGMKLPAALRLARDGKQYKLSATRPGRYVVQLELLAKIQRAEPWNHVTFTGPVAAIATLTAAAKGGDVDIQLDKGTLLSTEQQRGVSRLKGVLGAERTVALRWQNKAAEAARHALITCVTTASAQITPTVIKLSTQLKYDVLQGKVAQLTILLPAGQSLTRVVGDQIRDWRVDDAATTTAENPDAPAGDGRVLTIEFIKPVEKSYELTLLTEQVVDAAPFATRLEAPQPTGIERETGSLSIAAEDVLVDSGEAVGLRRINAPAGQWAAFQFFSRPAGLQIKLERVQPVINVASRATATLEESRLLIHQALNLDVEKAGIYELVLTTPADFTVTDVQGEGIEDWKVASDGLTVQFSRRVLGKRQISIQLEQPLKNAPEQIVLAPLRVRNAARETANIGVAPSAGIRVRTRELTGAREVPINQLAPQPGEILGFTADQPQWKLVLSVERLDARLIADIFNLVTVGDGLVGGSASIRYAILNQGVQQLRVQLPAHWKNVEFTGPDIRRRELQGDAWVIDLQEKAWGGYTLVVTYDYQFDPHQATLSLASAHALDVERETGSIAVMSAASVQISPQTIATQPGAEARAPRQNRGSSEGEIALHHGSGQPSGSQLTNATAGTIHRIDESELSAPDRALATRPILLAYRYSGGDQTVPVDVTRYEQASILQAVADRTQLTTVLTDEGQLLTQASFMVKNNDKQFQQFQLPAGAEFWGCYVDGLAVKAERDPSVPGQVMVPLRRVANRDQAFAVEIVYVQKIGRLKSWWPRNVQLAAPQTDVQTTYAEWELFVPESHQLSRFGGNMTIAAGTTYGVRNGWRDFRGFYAALFREPILLLGTVIAIGLAAWSIAAWKLRARILAVGAGIGCLVLVGWLYARAMEPAMVAAIGMSDPARLNTAPMAQFLEEQRSTGVGPTEMGQFRGERRPAQPSAAAPVPPNSSALEANGIQSKDAPEGELITRTFAVDRSVIDDVQNGNDAFRGMASGGGAAVDMKKLYEDAGVPFPSGAAISFDADNSRIIARNTPANLEVLEDIIGSSGKHPATRAGFDRSGGAAAVPTVAGIRPIRIDVPRTGTRYAFTKVLNVTREALAIRAWAFDATVRRAIQGGLVLGAVAIGALVLWLQLRRRQPSRTLVTVGLGLVLASVVGLLMLTRTLGAGLILLPPLLGACLAAIALRSWWERRREQRVGDQPPGPAITTAATTLMLLLATEAFAGQFGGARPINTTPITRPLSVESAIYSGTVREKVAELQAELVILAENVPAEGITWPLFATDIAIQEFSASSANATLARSGDAVGATLTKNGRYTLRFKFLVKPSGDVSKRKLVFGIPAALSSQLKIAIAEPDASVEVPSAVSYHTTTANDQTEVDAVLGAAGSVALEWTPRVKKISEMAATASSLNHALVTVGVGAVNIRSWIEYQVTQGELRQLLVQIPAGHRVLRVEGQGIRTWNLDPAPEQSQLRVDLTKGVTPSYRLMVETEKPIVAFDKSGADLTVEIPHASDVRRETGMVAIQGSDELAVSIKRSDGLTQADPDEFVRSAKTDSPAVLLATAYRFFRPGFELELHAAPLQPQVEAIVRNLFRIGRDHRSVQSTVDYTIKKAGIFAVQVALPADYRVALVAGEKISQWVETTQGEQRLLEVTFNERITGSYRLAVTLEQWVKESPTAVAVVGGHPVGVQKLTGFVTVATDLGVQAKSSRFDGLIEVPAGSVGSGTAGQLAFKFIQTAPAPSQPWTLSLLVEQMESWVRAEVVNWVTFNPAEMGLISGRSVVRYDVQNAPARELRLRVPKEFKNVEITGSNIRRRDETDGEWRIELQSPAAGTHDLTVTWEVPLSTGSSPSTEVEILGVTALGVERETGMIAIVAPAPLQVSPKSADDNLLVIDDQALPEWAGSGKERAALAYRYLRSGYQLRIRVQRFEDVEVLQALVDRAVFTSVVSEDGQMMTEMKLDVRNNGRQYLELTLPDNAEVWSAFVAGQAVRPSQRSGKILLPLERSGAGGAPVSVVLTYVNAIRFPARRGIVDLITPAMDVPLKDVRWDLFLPPEYEYSGFGGSMARAETATDTAAWRSQARSFSYQDYIQAESQSAAASESEYVQNVFQADEELTRGNVKNAVEYFNRAGRQRLSGLKSGKADVQLQAKEVERKLKQAQGSNVISAQQLNLERYGQGEPGQPAGAPSRRQVAETAAVEQWEKLQHAQEMAEVVVNPLRVNLPSRGLRHAFTQTLQTEVGKPMTIQFDAASTRGVSVLTAIGVGVAGLAGLWAIVGAILNRRGA